MNEHHSDQPGSDHESAPEQAAKDTPATDDTGPRRDEAAWQALEDELRQQREAVLRIQAEADNRVKREQKALERHRERALEGIIRDLLDVRDSIEMGLQASDLAGSEAGSEGPLERLHNGMQMTLKLLDKVLAGHGAEIIDPHGERFDPDWHEAVSVQAGAEAPKDTVVAVMQKGCRLHERLLRPAMVVVAGG
jgi:molecular chaperone GrpE